MNLMYVYVCRLTELSSLCTRVDNLLVVFWCIKARIAGVDKCIIFNDVLLYVSMFSDKAKPKKSKKTKGATKSQIPEVEAHSQPTEAPKLSQEDDALAEISKLIGNLSVTANPSCNKNNVLGLSNTLESFSEFDVSKLSVSRHSNMNSPSPLQTTRKLDSSKSNSSYCTHNHSMTKPDSVIEPTDDSLSPSCTLATGFFDKETLKENKNISPCSNINHGVSSTSLPVLVQNIASPTPYTNHELIGSTPETSTYAVKVREMRRDSIDDLLADLSDQLKTPARSDMRSVKQTEMPLVTLNLNSPTPCMGNDSILTGYVTPSGNERTTSVTLDIMTPGDENSLLNVAKGSITRLSTTKTAPSCLADSTVPLFDVRTLETFTDSELSLFDVEQSKHGSLHHKTSLNVQSKTYHEHSVTKSTPLNVGTNDRTYGDFDIVPQLSALSFNE